jgi:hypothetical protein
MVIEKNVSLMRHYLRTQGLPATDKSRLWDAAIGTGHSAFLETGSVFCKLANGPSGMGRLDTRSLGTPGMILRTAANISELHGAAASSTQHPPYS